MSDQTTPEQIVQALATSYHNLTGAPGGCIAVCDPQFEEGGYVYPYGTLGVDDARLVTADTVFGIASVTKVFTSTLLGVAIQYPGINLTDTLGKWLNFDNTFTPENVGSQSLQAITLAQLATHTSGMPEQPTGLPTNYSQQLFADEVPNPDQINWWNLYPGSWTPPNETCFIYSNIGFVTLGFAVTQMFPTNRGRNYNQILAEYITGPLFMAHTGATIEPSWLVAAGCNAVYVRSNGKIILKENNPTHQQDYDLKTTGQDLLQFLSAQLDPPSTLRTLRTAIGSTHQIRGPYPFCANSKASVTIGLGWQVTTGSIDGNSCNIFAKDGGTSLGGYEAFVTFVPDLGCGVAVLSNQCIPAAPALSPPNSLPSATAQQIICALHPDFKPPQPL